MKKQLFQYSVLFHTYEEKDGKREYKDTQVIIEPKYILAKSESELTFKITREIDEKYASNPDDVEIIISNFQ